MRREKETADQRIVMSPLTPWSRRPRSQIICALFPPAGGSKSSENKSPQSPAMARVGGGGFTLTVALRQSNMSQSRISSSKTEWTERQAGVDERHWYFGPSLLSPSMTFVLPDAQVIKIMKYEPSFTCLTSPLKIQDCIQLGINQSS